MLNRIVLMGRLTRDPELRKTQSDTPVCSFSLAVDRDYKKDGEKKETDFIDIVAWRATSEFVSKFFTKGRMAVVEGRLQIRDWTDKEGNKRRSAEVIADNVYFGDSKPKDGGDVPAYEGEPGAGVRRAAQRLYTELWRREWRTAVLRKMEREGRLPSLPHIHIRRRIKYAKLCYL